MRDKTIRKLVICAAMSAMAVVLAYFIHIPIIPGLPFLLYDPADIVIYLTTFVLGIPYGLIVTIVASVGQGLLANPESGIIGIAMHIFATGMYVMVAGLVAKALKKKKKKSVSLVFATLAGIAATIIAMAIWNIWLTPIYMNIPRKLLVKDYLGWILLFNLIKPTINGFVAIALERPVTKGLVMKK